jgi:transcriptional regulator with GAF, ATPase, and Fis domain
MRETLPQLLRHARTADDVLMDVVAELQPIIPGLWRVSIRRFLQRAGQLELVAVWSATHTQLVPGIRMSAGATSMPEVHQSDRPVFSAESARERTLLDHVLFTDGAGSWVSIPIHRAHRIVGLLSISAVRHDAVDSADRGFFEELGKLVENKLENVMDFEEHS